MDTTPARRSPLATAPVGASFPSDELSWEEDLADDDVASQAPGSDFDVDEDERFWTAPAVNSDHNTQAGSADAKHGVDDTSLVPESNTGKPKKPALKLLDLPVDVLDLIMREITHTNDMCSLTLTCSTLHRLAIPVIYSRFDIVWPDNSVELQPRTGVDALTFGLATLVMGNELFNEQPVTATTRDQQCDKCEQVTSARNAAHPRFRRRGNDYARHVRKFSLGNGPAEWVRDYTVGKEAGKMLGTLVALAVGRMRNLETFSWDMPTGVIRDVWMSLSSLGDRHDNTPCRLERVHIRWHNNWESQDAPTSPVLQVQNPGHTGINATSQQNALNAAANASNNHANLQAGAGADDDDDAASDSYADAVELPTFSLLPPLKALSVLDIDELPYLDEMKSLIGRSRRGLRELRVGIADHVKKKDWVSSWEGQGAQPVSAATAHGQAESQNQRRVGGVLGILFGQLEEPKAVEASLDASLLTDDVHEPKSEVPADQRAASVQGDVMDPKPALQQEHVSDQEAKENTSTQPLSSQQSPEHIEQHDSVTTNLDTDDGKGAADDPSAASIKGVFTELFQSLEHQKQREPNVPEQLQAKLALEVLELERVPISPRIMIRYLDWSRLNQLTLLGCQNTDALWKALAGDKTLANKRSFSLHPQKPKDSLVDQGLGLRKLYVDSVTPVLISFIKDALRPNTLETLILQSRGKIPTRVTAEEIFKGPLRRHRASLQRVSIDASEKTQEGELAHDSVFWERWIVSKEMLAFSLSGKMPQLRELCASINHKDWHFLLQQLPQAPRLRSLYLPFIKRLPRGSESTIDAREHALQIVDIAALRPEVRLTYIGIAWKCFEILEVSGPDEELDPPTAAPTHNSVNANDDDDEDDDGDDDEDDEDDAGNGAVAEEDEDDPLASVHAASMNALHRDDASELSEDESLVSKTRLKLREILFYDDKVAVFRARHGRL